MKANPIFLFVLVLFVTNCFAQNVTKIETKEGIHYLTNSIDYPITGTYTFKGEEPIVQLNGNGTGIYQLHELPKRDMIWGIECDESGTPKFLKGFDNAAYTLYYKYTAPSNANTEEDWNKVEFSIHFNTSKMFIQGERSKNFVETAEK